ncbi:MAG: uroporphyrinogen decarboxylase family protein [Eubacterium sp.]
MEKKEARIENIGKVVSLKKPDYVPIEHVITPELAIEFAGFPMYDGLWDTKLMIKAIGKTIPAYDGDFVRNTFYRSPRYYTALEAKSFVQSKSGFVQHPEVHSMEDTEYDDLIRDPATFLAGTCISRLYGVFDKEEPYRSIGLAKGMMTFNRTFGTYNTEVEKILDQNNIPVIIAATAETPFDFLADLLRSFSGISKDVRRHKEKVKEACEALLPLMIQKATVVPPSISKMIHIPLHMPPYLSEKIFSTLWWPTFKKMVDVLVEKGYYLYIFFEGDWTRYYDYLQELPPKHILGRFEYADPKIIKERLGSRMSLTGFYPIMTLAHGSKEMCLDKTKELMDILAPGGGYIFGFDKITTSVKDINIENITAVNNYVRMNGKY